MSQAAKPRVIGITGYAGAGKDSFGGLLKEAFGVQGKTAQVMASGDLVRQYTRDHQLGDPGDRAVLQKVASEAMAEHGYIVWVKQAIVAAAGVDILLYAGLRHPDEVAFLHEHGDITIGLDVPIELRYQWAQQRNRPGDNISFERFQANDLAERNGQGQQLEAVMRQLDVTVENDASFAQLGAVAAAIIQDFPDKLQPTYKASSYSA
jgi:hypothetical protein